MATLLSRRMVLGWLGAGAGLPMLAACGGDAEARVYPLLHKSNIASFADKALGAPLDR